MFSDLLVLYFVPVFNIVHQHLFSFNSGVLALVLQMEIRVLSLCFTQTTRCLMTAFGNKASVIYTSASQAFLFCDPILEKKFLSDPRMSSLHINDI